MAMDSHRAVIGSEDARALIFDMHSGRLIRSLPPNPGPVTALYVSKMDDFLITAGQPHTILFRYSHRHLRFQWNAIMIFFFIGVFSLSPPFARPFFGRTYTQAATKFHFTRFATKNHGHIHVEIQKGSQCDKCHRHNVH